MVSFAPEADGVSVWATNDTGVVTRGILEVSMVTFGAGSEIITTIPVTLSSNASSSRAITLASADLRITDPTRQCLAARLFVEGAGTARSVWFFDIFRNIAFPNAKLDVRRQQLDETHYGMVISASDYARTVVISGLPAGARASDNYFDLAPGDKQEVVVQGISAMDASTVSVSLWR
jgi:hypothetical protein